MVDGRGFVAGFGKAWIFVLSVRPSVKNISSYKGENKKFMAEKNEKINGLIDSSLRKLEGIADADTVIGNPIITASGFQIIPFSKITVGNLAGGGEYGNVKVVKESNAYPFAGGSGAVVSMKPMGFIIDDGRSCRLMRVPDEPLDNLIERAGEIIHDVMAKGK